MSDSDRITALVNLSQAMAEQLMSLQQTHAELALATGRTQQAIFELLAALITRGAISPEEAEKVAQLISRE